MTNITAQDIRDAWTGVEMDWIVRRNKEHAKDQYEVIKDWGGDVISEETMELVGRFATYEEGNEYAKQADELLRAQAVLDIVHKTLWAPIDTVPPSLKDGREIIAYGCMRGDYGYTDDQWTWTGIKWACDKWQVTKPTHRHFTSFNPTHWCRLPEFS